MSEIGRDSGKHVYTVGLGYRCWYKTKILRAPDDRGRCVRCNRLMARTTVDVDGHRIVGKTMPIMRDGKRKVITKEMPN